MSAWGCPHNINGRCARVKGIACQMGMKGCVLAGRFVFAEASRNRPGRRSKAARSAGTRTRDANDKE
jgi:hypothetical protein